MPVEFIGSRISALDALTNVSAVKITAGGGGPGVVDGDGVIQGTASVGINYPAADKLVFAAYDIVGAGGTALDFTAGGTEEGQLIYIWANGVFGLQSTGTTISNFPGGLGIVVDSNTTLGNDYACWSIYGLETYPGGYQKLVIDPTKTPSASGGTPDLSAIRHVGVAFCAVAGKNNIQGFYMDAIDVGSGLRIYGSGTDQDGFEDLRAADEGDSNNRYGVIKSLDAGQNILQVQGKLIIGDATGTNETIFSDIDKTIVMGQPQYQNGTSFENAIPDDYLEIKIEGNSTSGTDVTFGIVVSGADVDGNENLGRNGVTFLGNNLYNVNFNFNDGNIDSLKMYGCTLRNFRPTGGLVWDADANHELVGCFIDNCSRLKPDSGVFIRNTTFLNHTSVGLPENQAALYFTSNTPSDTIIDVKNSSFVANDYGIEHPATGTFAYDNLKFSANTYDVYFNYTGGAIAPDPEFELTINLTNGANATTFISGANEGDTQLLSAVTLTLTNIKTNSEVRIRPTGNPNVVLFAEETVTDGTSEYTYNFPPTYSDVDIFVMNVSGYQWYSQTNFTLSAGSENLFISQIPERNYST